MACLSSFNSHLQFRFLPVGALMYLNEATLLNNVRLRYMKDHIYVSTNVRLLRPVFSSLLSCVVVRSNQKSNTLLSRDE